MEPPDLAPLLDALPGEHIAGASTLGLTLRPTLDAAAWSAFIASLAQLAGHLTRKRDTTTAWLGDVLAYGHGRYRGQIAAYAEAAGLDPGTLRIAKLVCTRIPVLSRHNALSWSHHCEVGKAFREPDEIRHWLTIAVAEHLSVRGLRKRIRAHLAGPKPEDPPALPLTPYALLGRLHALGRFVQNHPDAWSTWSAATCERALDELKPLRNFIAALQARAERPAARRLAS